MPIGDFNPVQKPSFARGGLTQKQKGDISQSVDKELKERSKGVCELCRRANATERAHLTGRPHIDHKTAVTDLLHLCAKCHDWLDETPEGIKSKRFIATAINNVLRANRNLVWKTID